MQYPKLVTSDYWPLADSTTAAIKKVSTSQYLCQLNTPVLLVCL
jgi:hypothetical protein